jgi:hypothetical protein
MNHSGWTRALALSLNLGCILIFVGLGCLKAAAGDGFELPQTRQTLVVAGLVSPCPAPGPLGTFQPTPYIMVRGNWPLGGGYSPLEVYGDQSMSVYGPLSPLRSTSAPVVTYSRGYDGRVYAVPATSSSTPNLPALSPVVYPTQRSYYYAPRVDRSPPQWSSGMNWIDQQ